MDSNLAAWIGLLLATLVNLTAALVRWLDADRIRRNIAAALAASAASRATTQQTSHRVQALGLDVAANSQTLHDLSRDVATLAEHTNGLTTLIAESNRQLGHAEAVVEQIQAGQPPPPPKPDPPEAGPPRPRPK